MSDIQNKDTKNKNNAIQLAAIRRYSDPKQRDATGKKSAEYHKRRKEQGIKLVRDRAVFVKKSELNIKRDGNGE